MTTVISLPETGSFTAYKKCVSRNKSGEAVQEYVVTLKIPATAKRVKPRSWCGENKCRASSAKVVKIEPCRHDNVPHNLKRVYSLYDEKFSYEVGQVVTPDYYNSNSYESCGAGINFFMTRKEAENYYL